MLWQKKFTAASNFSKFLRMVNRYEKTKFWNLWFLGFFCIFTMSYGFKNVRIQNVVRIKNQFFMPINHVKEFSKSIHFSHVSQITLCGAAICFSCIKAWHQALFSIYYWAKTDQAQKSLVSHLISVTVQQASQCSKSLFSTYVLFFL